jgi:hypothetical protein
MRHEEEENATEQNAETDAYKSFQSLIKGIIGYELLASLTGRSAPMPPAQTLQASRTHGSRHRTTFYLAAFVHNRAFLEDALLLESKGVF